MKSCLVLLAVVLLCQLVNPQLNNDLPTFQQVTGERPEDAESLGSRVRRQSGNRRINLFSLLGELFTETRNEGREALNQISEVVSQNIVPSGSDYLIAVNSGNSDNMTEAPFRITQDDFRELFRRNIGGLGRLFGKEFRAAIQQSDKNVNLARKELRDSLRRFVTTNSTT